MKKILNDSDAAASLNQVVSIYCFGRSGTHFLKSLLDGHPKIILSMLSGPAIFELWERLVQENGEQIFQQKMEYVIDQIFAAFEDSFNDGKVYPTSQMNGMCNLGENRDEIFTIDKKRFSEKYQSIMSAQRDVDCRFFYQSIQLSAAYGIGYEYDFASGIPVIVEGGIHFAKAEEATQKFMQVFPDTKLLYMVRQPNQAFASALMYLIKSHQATIDNLSANIMAIFAPVPMRMEWADRTRIIKLEELHTRSRDVLEALCDYLGIEWSDTLLSSTFGGKKWWNTATSAVLSGFNTKTISNSYDELLSSFDKFRLDMLLRTKYNRWNYETFEYYNVDLLKQLCKEPFRFEKFFISNKSDAMILRKIMTKLIEKQINYLIDTPLTDQADYYGELLLKN